MTGPAAKIPEAPSLAAALRYAESCLQLAARIAQGQEPPAGPAAEPPDPEAGAELYAYAAAHTAFNALRDYYLAFQDLACGQAEYEPVYAWLLQAAPPLPEPAEQAAFQQLLKRQCVAHFFEREALIFGRERLREIESGTREAAENAERLGQTPAALRLQRQGQEAAAAVAQLVYALRQQRHAAAPRPAPGSASTAAARPPLDPGLLHLRYAEFYAGEALNQLGEACRRLERLSPANGRQPETRRP